MTVIGGSNYSKKQIARMFAKTHTQPLTNKQRQSIGHQCPDCGAGYAHVEDNGEQGSALAFICTDCGWQWDAKDITI